MRSLSKLLLLIAVATLVVAANPGGCSVAPPQRLYLQQVGPDSAIVKWRGAPERACVGTDLAGLDTAAGAECVAAIATDGNHKEARFVGLLPDTHYYYALGDPRPGAGSPSQYFRTAPLPGEVPKDDNVHIWIIGDSGTETERSPFGGSPSHPGEAEEVKQGFLAYNQDKEPVDLFLLLGDNAYLDGTDAQWQGAFFDIYPEIMKSAAVWPTIGNHEMGGTLFDLGELLGFPPGSLVLHLGGTSNSPDPFSYDDGDATTIDDGPPYLDIFTLPSAGEVGGVPSGTEQYYAFDYGNVHVVSLDSQLSNRDDVQREAMRSWLIDDLESNRRDWTIVIFHHPPYTKGENHDSDVEDAEIWMREQFTPVFEDYGVDVVYGGHSHSYERSYYLNGHTGPSTSFDPLIHTELNDFQQSATGNGSEEYAQISPGSGADDKAVYTVAGSSGKADELNPCLPGVSIGCTLPDWLQHPAHYFSLAEKGSVVVDASASELRSRFIDVSGNVLDEFTITREAGRSGGDD
jgi:hypothetical protein